MANKIVVLEENIVRKIAAGEVVERPASVVKELVENSIDAGSTSIEVRVKESGKKYISVIDDGEGMNEEEAKLSILRYSTSKIKTIDDLFSVKTLGFRGEALPSIAAVSFLTLITKDENSETGIKIEVEGGKVKKTNKVGTNRGTEVIVQNLFYNTPARLKYLKSNYTEMFHVSNIVTVYSLSHLEISFKLYQDGMQIFNSPKTSNLKEKILYSFGREVFDEMIPIEGKNEKIKVRGFISLPHLSKSNRYYQIFFVNSRWVRNKIFNFSLEEAYREYIPKDRYPICVIHLDIQENLIDVNVHPTKMEVKIAEEGNLKSLIINTVKSALKNSQRPQVFEVRKETLERVKELSQEVKEPLLPYSTKKEEVQQISFLSKDFQIVGQIYKTYIIIEKKDGILIVDQHTLQERYLFENLKKNKKKINVQNLLYPIVVNLSSGEYILLEKNKNIFEELGFALEEFGKNSFILRSVPYIFSKFKNEQDFKDVLDKLLPEIERSEEDKIIKIIACRAAVRAGDNLEKEEIYKLLQYFENLDNSYTCPHGRPLMIKISKDELDKKFLRK